jgi:hypothetical protein
MDVSADRMLVALSSRRDCARLAGMVGEDKASGRAGQCAECGWDDEFVGGVFGQAGVPGQCIKAGGAYQREKPRQLSYAATDHYPLRCDRVDDVAQPGGEVGGLEFDGCPELVAVELLGWTAPAGGDRCTTGHSSRQSP